jgi:LysM repeat protein/murein endopeptidase
VAVPYRPLLRAPLLAAAALLAIAAAGCAPRHAAALPTGSPGAGAEVLDEDAAESHEVDPSSGTGGDDELAAENDDFAALAYALHGMEPPEADPVDAAVSAEDEHDAHESDDIETPAEWQPPTGTVKSPLADLPPEEIRRRLKDEPASLGSISIGPPNRGALFNGVQMPLSDKWAMTDPGNAYGTREAIDQLIAAVEAVHEKYPKSPKLIVGHWSSRRGGRLKPHKSHQSGRDVDVSYYYTNGAGWYSLANAKNLDRPRTWAFVKALLTKGDVEMILIDTSIQKMLRDHALAAGEDRAFVDRVFQIAGEKHGFAPVRHARGHADHIHIRFRSPEAVASGKIAEAFIPRPAPPAQRRSTAKHAVASRGGAPTGTTGAKSPREPVKDDPSYVSHRARSGDTLDALARRYGTTVAAIRAANGLKGNDLKMKKSYRIPVAKPPTSGGRPAEAKQPPGRRPADAKQPAKRKG